MSSTFFLFHPFFFLTHCCFFYWWLSKAWLAAALFWYKICTIGPVFSMDLCKPLSVLLFSARGISLLFPVGFCPCVWVCLSEAIKLVFFFFSAAKEHLSAMNNVPTVFLYSFSMRSEESPAPAALKTPSSVGLRVVRRQETTAVHLRENMGKHCDFWLTFFTTDDSGVDFFLPV